MPWSPHASPTKKCAIHTRKSIAQALDVDYGSIEAQRVICASYIASQRPKGWTEITKHYEDDIGDAVAPC